jgi:hypothetical protein
MLLLLLLLLNYCHKVSQHKYRARHPAAATCNSPKQPPYCYTPFMPQP